MNIYDIGGVWVAMTAEQAVAWNAGRLTPKVCAGAYVLISHVAELNPNGNGNRILPLHNPQLYECVLPLWEYIGGHDGESEPYRKHMEGREAILVRLHGTDAKIDPKIPNDGLSAQQLG